MNPAARPLLLVAALFAPLGVIAPKGLVPLLLIAAIWQFGLCCQAGHWRRPFEGMDGIFAGLIGAWALLSALWSLDALAAVTTFAKLATVLLATLVMLDGTRRLAGRDKPLLIQVLLTAFAAATVLLGFETLTGAAGHKWLVWRNPDEYTLTVLNRAGAILLLASWPAALILWRLGRRYLAGLAIIMAMAVVCLGVSSSNKAAVLLSLAGAALAWFLRHRFPRPLALALAAGIMVAPVLPTGLLAPDRLAGYFDETQYSALHRLHIWYFAAVRITDKPIIGWGLDASRRIPGGDTKLPRGGHVMGVHPHNASLQIWLELGAVGAFLAALLIAGLCLRLGVVSGRAGQAAGAGLMLSAMVIANLSFGIWQTWWMASLALSGIMFALALRLSGK